MHNWAIIITTLIFAILLTISITSFVSAEHFTLYNNSKLGISMLHPAIPIKWTAIEEGYNVTFFPPFEGPPVYLQIQVQDLTGVNITLDKYATAYVKNFINNSAQVDKYSFELKDNKNTTIGGIPALQKHYTFYSFISGIFMEVLDTFIISNNLGYIISFSSDTSQYANYIEHIIHRLNSFKITS